MTSENLSPFIVYTESWSLPSSSSNFPEIGRPSCSAAFKPLASETFASLSAAASAGVAFAPSPSSDFSWASRSWAVAVAARNINTDEISPCRILLLRSWVSSLELCPERSAGLLPALEAPLHLVPLDVLEEGVDVLRRRGSVVDGVRVLVHVHHQQWSAVGGILGVVPAPADAELSILEVVVEHRPAAPSSERRPDCPEEFLEATEAPEGVAEGGLDRVARLAVSTEVPEVQLVENHRVVEAQLAFLEPADEEPRGVLVHAGELLLDLVEVLDRSAVVVLVVRAEEPLREPLELRRVEGQGLNGVLPWCHSAVDHSGIRASTCCRRHRLASCSGERHRSKRDPGHDLSSAHRLHLRLLRRGPFPRDLPELGGGWSAQRLWRSNAVWRSSRSALARARRSSSWAWPSAIPAIVRSKPGVSGRANFASLRSTSWTISAMARSAGPLSPNRESRTSKVHRSPSCVNSASNMSKRSSPVSCR